MRWLMPLLLLGGAGQAAPDEPGFTSPRGDYEVRFELLEQRVFSDEESLAALDDVDHVRYRISFFRSSDGAVAASIVYADVYGWSGDSSPTATDVIFGWLEWSPGEDFVVVPGEDWASAPGTPERKVLALGEEAGWKEAAFVLDKLYWAGPLVAIGARHNDCDYSVDAFDGATGEQRPLLAGLVSPLGARLASAEGRLLHIETTLDNCSSDDARERFAPDCFAFDLDTRKLDSVPCDAAGAPH